MDKTDHNKGHKITIRHFVTHAARSWPCKTADSASSPFVR